MRKKVESTPDGSLKASWRPDEYVVIKGWVALTIAIIVLSLSERVDLRVEVFQGRLTKSANV